jgi:hypothetical protein
MELHSNVVNLTKAIGIGPIEKVSGGCGQPGSFQQFQVNNQVYFSMYA